ncbi:hypothetical protein Hdeb2414_s0037g00733541 [Helianthus debilis subsp. tardiflorus]
MGGRKGLRERPLQLLKHGGSDPDDHATLTDFMKKKALEEKKRKLDEQAAALLASKKAKLQKGAPPAPSESEIDMGVFTAKHGNLLEQIFEASGTRGTRSLFVCSGCPFLLLTSSFFLKWVLNLASPHARLTFQRLLFPLLRHLGRLTCPLPVMTWVERVNQMM